MTCSQVTGEERSGEEKKAQERRYFQNKDDIAYVISDYYSAQCSPGEWFDVTKKAYSITFFPNNQQGIQQKPKIILVTNRIIYQKYVQIPLFTMISFLLQPEQKGMMICFDSMTSFASFVAWLLPVEIFSHVGFGHLVNCVFVSSQGGVGTAAVSLRSSVGKSTYCTSLGKVTDMAVCPCHLSLELHKSAQTKESQAAETAARPQPAIVLRACGWM